MLRTWRALFLGLSWIYLAAVMVQVFLAGLFIFNSGDPEAHKSLGWSLHLVPIVVVVLAWAAKSGRQTLWLALALAIVQFIQPILPSFAASTPSVAALHPVLAMIIFLFAVLVAIRAWRLWRSGAPLAVSS